MDTTPRQAQAVLRQSNWCQDVQAKNKVYLPLVSHRPVIVLGSMLWKLSISKSVYSVGVHVIRRLIVNYDTSRQCLHCNWTDLWYLSSVGVTWPSDLGCSTFGKRILPLTRSRLAVPCVTNFTSGILTLRCCLVCFLAWNGVILSPMMKFNIGTSK